MLCTSYLFEIMELTDLKRKGETMFFNIYT